MILSGIIILLLLLSFWKGWRRGLFMELMSLASTIISFVLASYFYQAYSVKLVNYFKLSVPTETLKILNSTLVEKATMPFFAAFTWLLIFIVANLLVHLIILLLRRFRNLLSFGKIGRALAGVLSLLVTYFSLQLLLTLLSLFPMAGLQNFLAGSDLARWMVLNTPISSSALLQLFIENLVHISPYR